jgi:Protein of unknown function (DUF1566)
MKKFVFFLNLNAIAMIFVLFFSMGTHAECTKDVDCKGDRVCEKGICVDQGQKESSQKKIIAKDGRFIAYADRTVLDTNTNLMWAAHDNGSDITWHNAKSYCENYRGGGYTDWRMPTQDELAGLSDAGKTYIANCGDKVHLTELIHLTCCCLWALEMRVPMAASFAFNVGVRSWDPLSVVGISPYLALPVRSGK